MPEKKPKFYAVRKGRTTGILMTWKECQASVIHFPGAEFKSFPTREEAEAFLSKTYALDTASPDTQSPVLDIYVDGSYHIRRHVYGWGVVILSGETPVTLRGSGDEADYLPARNVAGEVFASLHAMQWAVEHGYTSIRIFYDYEGICKWATGDWKTNTPISIMYANAVRETYAPKLHVTFEKVEAHTGVMYNEMADQVAKSAVGL